MRSRSANGPLRTMMMLVPLIVVAVLASMGGYHYRTLAAASQGLEPVEDETLDVEVIDLGASVGESARLPTDDLFADFANEASTPQTPNTAVDRSFAPAVHNQTAETAPPRRRRQREQATDNSHRYPSEALRGWQFADARTNEDAEPETIQTTADTEPAEPVEFDFSNEEPEAPPAKFQGIQAAIDARQNQPSETSSVTEENPVEEAPFAEEPIQFDEADLIETKPVPEAYRRNANTEPEAKPQPKTKRRREPRTLKEAAVVLQELRIRKYRLEPEANGSRFRFRCAITDPNNPRVRILFTTVEDEPLTAVIKVLRQVEEWRAKH